jgi:hypothetical protein
MASKGEQQQQQQQQQKHCCHHLHESILPSFDHRPTSTISKGRSSEAAGDKTPLRSSYLTPPALVPEFLQRIKNIRNIKTH